MDCYAVLWVYESLYCWHDRRCSFVLSRFKLKFSIPLKLTFGRQSPETSTWNISVILPPGALWSKVLSLYINLWIISTNQLRGKIQKWHSHSKSFLFVSCFKKTGTPGRTRRRGDEGNRFGPPYSLAYLLQAGFNNSRPEWTFRKGMLRTIDRIGLPHRGKVH